MDVRKPSDLGMCDGDGDWVNRHVSRRLKAKRILSNMSQERLAAALGLNYQQLQRYESGKSRLTCSLVYRAAQALDVPIAYFFEGIVADGTEGPDLDIDKTALSIARTCQRIPSARIRKSLLDLADELARSADGWRRGDAG